MENRQGTPSYNRVMESYIRELTRAGYPVKPSQLASGVTSDFRSFQGSREWLKYLQMGGFAEQILFDVKLPIQSLMAKPSTQFAYHLLNSGVKPYIATNKAFDFAESRGLNDIPGFESMRFDPSYYHDPVNYRTIDPEFVSKPGRRLAIIPNSDIYNPSYIPLTTGLRRNIAGFDPSMFNPEIASALNQSIYPHGGNTPSWDHMTSRHINDFDYHKYIAYSSDLDYLVRSGPITKSQLARNLEDQLFNQGIFSNSIGGRNRDMMYRADWFTDNRLLTTVPTQKDALSAMSGITGSIGKHFENAKEHGLFDYSSALNLNMNKYSGLSNGDIIRMLDMFTVLSRRGVPSLFGAGDPLLGPGVFTPSASEGEFKSLQSVLGDVPIFDLRQELYRLNTIPDRNATLSNLDIDARAEEMNALSNALKKIQDEDESASRSRSHATGFRRGGGASNYFANLDRKDKDNPDFGDPDASRANRAAKKMGQPAALPYSKTLIPSFQALPGGLFTHGSRPEMFTEEQLSQLKESHIEKAIQQIYSNISTEVLAEVQNQLGRKDVPGYMVSSLARSRFLDLYKTKGSGGTFDTMLLQTAFQNAGIPIEDMLQRDPNYKTRGGFRFLGGSIPSYTPEEPVYADPEEAKLRAELEELDTLRENITYKDVDTRKYIVARRAEINSELERFQTIDERAGLGKNYPAEYADRADIIPGTNFEVIPGKVDSPSSSDRRFMRHEQMFSTLGVKFKHLQEYVNLSKSLKSFLPIAGVSLAAMAAGSMFGMPELAVLGSMPFAFTGSTKYQPSKDDLFEKYTNMLEKQSGLEIKLDAAKDPREREKIQAEIDKFSSRVNEARDAYKNYSDIPETPDVTPKSELEHDSFREYTPWKKGDNLYKLYGTLGYD
ncbi:MAG: hypothetical protein WC343_13280, partial [Bacilli bacterium]